MGVPRPGTTAALTVAVCTTLVFGAGAPTGGASQPATGGGSIRGRVTMPGASSSGTLKVTTDEKICGLSVADEGIVADKTGGIAHAVVAVKGLAWSGPAAQSLHVVNKGCRFVPHVSVARPGAMLEVTTEDPTLHTTHLYAANRSLFNIALPMPGIVIKRPLEKSAGVVRMVCDTHPWMRGFIAVTADRSVVTEADGGFQMLDVPPGSYEITIWHESLQASPQKITVVAGRTAELNVTLARR